MWLGLSRLLLILFLNSPLAFSQNDTEAITIEISNDVYTQVPFSSQFSGQGALIKNIDFKSVNSLTSQVEQKFKHLLYGKNLKSRGESHITIITPPEGKSGFIPGSTGIDHAISTNKLISMYKSQINDADFKIECLGMQKNTKGKIVFYLVIASKDIVDIRKNIEKKVLAKGIRPTHFKALQGYYPHITIGYIGGDIHGVIKDKSTCIADINLK